MSLKVQRDLKIGNLKEDVANFQKLEILGALQQLGDTLSAAESAFVTDQSMKSGKNIKILFRRIKSIIKNNISVLYILFSLILCFTTSGNAALQQFVEIKPGNGKENMDAIENIALKKVKVYKDSS